LEEGGGITESIYFEEKKIYAVGTQFFDERELNHRSDFLFISPFIYLVSIYHEITTDIDTNYPFNTTFPIHNPSTVLAHRSVHMSMSCYAGISRHRMEYQPVLYGNDKRHFENW